MWLIAFIVTKGLGNPPVRRQQRSQQSIENFAGTDFASLADALSVNGAQLYVESNGEILFSNLSDDADELSEVTVSTTTHTSYVDGEVIISRKIATNGQIYYLYAWLEDLEEQQESQDFQAFLCNFSWLVGQVLSS